MLQRDTDRGAFHLMGGGQGAADRGHLAVIDRGEGPVREALADVLLVLRVDVLGVADVDRDRHARLRQSEDFHHGFAHAGPAFGLRIAVVGQLHPGEGDFVLPEGPPARDELRQLLDVELGRLGAVCVAFALIPEHAAERVRSEVDDLAVVEPGGSALELAHGQRILRRRRDELLALLLRLGDGGAPDRHLLRMQLAGFALIEGEVVLQAGVIVRLRLRVGRLRLGGDPGFDGRAADGSVDQSDGHADFAVDLAAEEEERRGKTADGFGRALLPEPFAFGGGRGGMGRRLAIVPDERQLGARLLGREVVGRLHGHRHVGLAGAEPDFADEDVLHLELVSVLAGDGQRARFGRSGEGV